MHLESRRGCHLGFEKSIKKPNVNLGYIPYIVLYAVLGYLPMGSDGQNNGPNISCDREGRYLKATAQVLHEHNGLWFQDESFVVSRCSALR